MKKQLFVLLLIVLLAFCSTRSIDVTKVPIKGTFRSFENKDSDTKCSLCVFGLAMVEQAIKRGEKDIAKLVAGMCQYIPSKVAAEICATLVKDFGGRFVEWLLKREAPDWICSKVGLCKSCHLIHGYKYYVMNKEEREQNGLREDPVVDSAQFKARMFGGIIANQITNVKQRSFNSSFPNIPPKIDIDGDKYSSVHLCHRGADWKGKDCNDAQAKIHPGAAEDPNSPTDGNCNGISGKNVGLPSWEAQYCQTYQYDRQMVFFGDSATAGFSIPLEWTKFQNLSAILPALIDELDWPMRSYLSGWTDDIDGTSLYLKYREHNRCAHRQFQNMGKNGAEMINLVEQINDANLSPVDKPVIATVAYIGNDICEPSLDLMTKPEDYRKQLLAGLTLLDSKVAPNSKVLLVGLADGEIIWDHLHNITHPAAEGLGVTYEQFYSFLTCTKQNPCVTWLTSDANMRRAATTRARELDAVLEDTVKNVKFKNFDMVYIDFSDLLTEAFVELGKTSIPIHEIIDDVDGFHPSIQYGHRIVAKILWNHLTTEHPDFFGPPNPNNAKIQELFGDQGGH